MDDAWRMDQNYVEEDEVEEIDIGDPGKTIAEDLVVTKYKMAGEIVNRVLKQVVARCVVGASVCELCAYGDSLLLRETGEVFKRAKDMRKGIAFPTCISVDNCICHFSPAPADPDHLLGAGEVAKVELAGHVDGFIASVCHTLVVGGEGGVEGRRGDVVLAAHFASEAALRALAPGGNTHEVADVVQRAALCYGCRPVEGMVSFQLKQNKLTSGKRVVLNPRGPTVRFDIEVHEVYALEIAVSTGEGGAREMDARTTVYKKTDDSYYQLKLKASRSFFTEVGARHDAMPFNLRSFPDESKAKLGLVECLKHKIVTAFPVAYERPGEFVAVFKFTVLLMPTGRHRITGLPFDPSLYTSQHSYLTDSLLADLLAQTVNLKTVKKKKKRLLTQGLAGNPPKPSPRTREATN